MLKKYILVCCLFFTIYAYALHAQKLSMPELIKIKSLKKNERDVYIRSKQYDSAEEKSAGSNSAITYRSSVIQNDRLVIRSIILVNSKELKGTMIEYSTYDEEESKSLRAWLNTHGYKQSKNETGGKTMIFFESKTGFIRFLEEPYELSNGIHGNRGSFIIEN